MRDRLRVAKIWHFIHCDCYRLSTSPTAMPTCASSFSQNHTTYRLYDQLADRQGMQPI